MRVHPVLTALLAVVVLLALPVQAARAHAVLVESSPADGARLRNAPAEIVLRFNEPIPSIGAKVLDSSGAPASPSGAAAEEGDTVRIPGRAFDRNPRRHRRCHRAARADPAATHAGPGGAGAPA